jgi:hypothetical protein
MTLDQIYKLIDNSTSIWDSGMITIQTIFIAAAGWLAYQQLILQKKNQYYTTAKEIVNYNLELNEYVRKLLSPSSTKKLDEHEYQIKFGKLPESFSRTINKVYQICENIRPEEDQLSKLYLEAEKKIEVLDNQNLWDAHYFKNSIARSIESEFLETLAYLEILNEKAPLTSREELINEFNNHVTKLPRFIGDKNSEYMKNFMELDLEIRKELRRYL